MHVIDQTVGPELLQSLKDLDQALHAPEAVIHMNRNPQVEIKMLANILYTRELTVSNSVVGNVADLLGTLLRQRRLYSLVVLWLRSA